MHGVAIEHLANYYVPMTPAAAPQAPTVFSTVGLPAARRVELWESHNATALIGLDVRAAEPLDATEVNVPLRNVHLARVTGSAHVVERTPDVISRAPSDAVAVYLTLRGDAWLQHANGSDTLRPGSALVLDADQPFARGFAAGLEELVIKVDRAALTSRVNTDRPVGPAGRFITTFGATADNAGSPPAGKSNQYARTLARLASRATQGGQRAIPDEAVILDLVAVLTAGPSAARTAAHRAAACLYIGEHLTDQNLGAGQVAAAIGLSERQLSRIFAADGTSVPRHILTRRLALAYQLLASESPATGHTAPTIAGIAARSGFTSAAYFSHAFRAHFGHRATEIRRGASAPVPPPGADRRKFLFPPSDDPALGP
jgi:AraC-like DNA-binding protein